MFTNRFDRFEPDWKKKSRLDVQQFATTSYSFKENLVFPYISVERFLSNCKKNNLDINVDQFKYPSLQDEE